MSRIAFKLYKKKKERKNPTRTHITGIQQKW